MIIKQVLSFVQKQNKQACYTFITTFIDTYHEWKKDDIATVALIFPFLLQFFFYEMVHGAQNEMWV